MTQDGTDGPRGEQGQVVADAGLRPSPADGVQTTDFVRRPIGALRARLLGVTKGVDLRFACAGLSLEVEPGVGGAGLRG